MFTGIVECMGSIAKIQEMDMSESGGQGLSVIIKDCPQILTDCHIGDSIAVNGICLTVTEFDTNTFKIGISPETVRRTNVGQWKETQRVNLERAISNEVRFGGHYVQGHVDTTALIYSAEQDGNSVVYTFQLATKDKQYMKYIVEKGFICIDGVSLTITNVDDHKNTFSIAMIKHTQENVTLPLKQVGTDKVNIEVDLTGKIIEKQIVAALNDQIDNVESPLANLINTLIDKKLSSR
ncbi:riboflavin synthase [Monosporozyma unispora]|nr:Riboflavin synthase alpha chain [Kazachstania unispora]